MVNKVLQQVCHRKCQSSDAFDVFLNTRPWRNKKSLNRDKAFELT